MTASAFRCGSNRRSSAKEARDNHHRRILFISPRTLVLPFFCDGRSSGRLASFVSFLTRAKEPPKAPDQQKGCDYSRHGKGNSCSEYVHHRRGRVRLVNPLYTTRNRSAKPILI